ncbi:phenazine biosynthesis-like domain-containing protein [Puma concolor]|uniref:Phenazine biosynthesis-like domain-containing protein n=1 Tax=Puma concolor TaxID=9696 RepID=A0A6P6HD58_PUMCO|nr:phenazine biosynthesis-like domain-containing protein [Puma concolor]
MHQKIAREMNLSETAFIRKLHPTDNFTQSSCFGLRWFTPATEVPLCGHATLASAAVLFYKIKNVNSTLTFVTLSGELTARRAQDGIILDLPLYPTHPQDFHEVDDLIKTAIGDTLVQDIRYSPDTRKLLVRLSDTYKRSFLENLKVNTQNLLQVENTGKVKGLILTLKGEPGGQSQAFDFYSRYFAPWVGVAEDPVTGSAHAVLSSYWSQQLGKKDMHGQKSGTAYAGVSGSGSHKAAELQTNPSEMWERTVQGSEQQKVGSLTAILEAGYHTWCIRQKRSAVQIILENPHLNTILLGREIVIVRSQGGSAQFSPRKPKWPDATSSCKTGYWHATQAQPNQKQSSGNLDPEQRKQYVGGGWRPWSLQWLFHDLT